MNSFDTKADCLKSTPYLQRFVFEIICAIMQGSSTHPQFSSILMCWNSLSFN